MLNSYLRKINENLIIALIAFLLVLSINYIFPQILEDCELKTYDYRMVIRGKIEINPHIILIDIDDNSSNTIGKWPWDRSIHAKMIEILTSNNARTIAYNILFRHFTHNKNDDLLIKATKNSGRIFYPVGIDFTISDNIGSKNEDGTPLINLLKPYSLDRIVGKNEDTLFSAKRIIAPYEELIVSSKGLGHISANRDHDGVIRRVPLIVKLDGVLFPSFAFNVLLDYLNISKENIIIRPGENIVLKQALFTGSQSKKDIIIPIDDKGMMFINYAGKWVETYKHYSFKDILTTNELLDKDAVFPMFEDDILIVNNVASGYNIKPVPLENNYPGGGIHANIINTILTEKFIKEVGSLVNIGIILILSILSASTTLFIKWYFKVISLFLLLSGYIIFNICLFVYAGFVLQILLPILAVFWGGMLATFYHVRSERLAMCGLTNEKQRLEKELEIISKKLIEKDKRIIVKAAELSEHPYNNKLKLEEKLKTEKGEKACLEEKKIALINKISSLEFTRLQKEAKKFHIITINRKLLEAFDLAKKVALTNYNVLLLGESGTGKELFANAIHKLSLRRHEKFLVIDVNTIPTSLSDSEFFGHVKSAFTGADNNKKGLFQEAAKGTIFLDEIGNLNFDIQAKLLRVLEDKKVRPIGSLKSEFIDIRVIAATDKNLAEEVAAKRFSKALFARLKRYPIILPPLRERIEDITYLVNEFIKKHKGNKNITGISQNAIETLCKYRWPENVRQLEDIVIRAIINTNNKELKNEDIKYAMEQELYSGYEKEEKRTVENTKGETPEIKIKNRNDIELIELLRDNQFNINNTAWALDINRNTLREYFKGICFKYLAECNIDFKKAAYAFGGDSIISQKIEKRMRLYYGNLISHINNYTNENIAKKECRKIFKNIPQKYFCFVEILVDYHFMNLKKENEIDIGDRSKRKK